MGEAAVSWNEIATESHELLRAAAQVEFDMRNLAACAPAMMGESAWPESGSHPRPSDEAIIRAVRTQRVLELAFDMNRRAAVRIAFYWMACGPKRRPAMEKELGDEYGPTLMLWSDARDAYADGRRGRPMCLMTLCDTLAQAMTGRFGRLPGENVSARVVRLLTKDCEFPPSKSPPDATCSIVEAAWALGVTRHTVRGMIRDRTIEASLVNGRWRVSCDRTTIPADGAEPDMVISPGDASNVSNLPTH